MERKSIGQFIAALRKANGLTQMQLAEKLNVSDKAVSRWERDETAPDISLIPVIADIFGVTCDELLCGERKINNGNASGDEEILSAKGEKQRRRILALGMSQYKNRSFISSGIAFAGLIAAAICNVAFNRAYLGFFIAAIFYLAAVICQAIFVNKALLSVSDDEFSSSEIQTFKKRVVVTLEFVVGFVVALIAFTAQLLGTWDAYTGVYLDDWLFVGSIFAAAAALLCVIISYIINFSLAKKGLWEITPKERRRRHNTFLAGGCIICLAIAFAISFGVYTLATFGGAAWLLAPAREFNDYESFAEFIERDVPSIIEDNRVPERQTGFMYIGSDTTVQVIEENDDLEVIDDPYYELFGEDGYGFAYNGERVVIKDRNGQILLDCEYNNKSVYYMDCGSEVDGWLPIKVVTDYDIPEGEKIVRNAQLIVCTVTAVEAGIALFIYLMKREKA